VYASHAREALQVIEHTLHHLDLEHLNASSQRELERFKRNLHWFKSTSGLIEHTYRYDREKADESWDLLIAPLMALIESAGDGSDELDEHRDDLIALSEDYLGTHHNRDGFAGQDDDREDNPSKAVINRRRAKLWAVVRSVLDNAPVGIDREFVRQALVPIVEQLANPPKPAKQPKAKPVKAAKPAKQREPLGHLEKGPLEKFQVLWTVKVNGATQYALREVEGRRIGMAGVTLTKGMVETAEQRLGLVGKPGLDLAIVTTKPDTPIVQVPVEGVTPIPENLKTWNPDGPSTAIYMVSLGRNWTSLRGTATKGVVEQLAAYVQGAWRRSDFTPNGMIDAFGTPEEAVEEGFAENQKSNEQGKLKVWKKDALTTAENYLRWYSDLVGEDISLLPTMHWCEFWPYLSWLTDKLHERNELTEYAALRDKLLRMEGRWCDLGKGAGLEPYREVGQRYIKAAADSLDHEYGLQRHWFDGSKKFYEPNGAWDGLRPQDYEDEVAEERRIQAEQEAEERAEREARKAAQDELIARRNAEPGRKEFKDYGTEKLNDREFYARVPLSFYDLERQKFNLTDKAGTVIATGDLVEAAVMLRERGAVCGSDQTGKKRRCDIPGVKGTYEAGVKKPLFYLFDFVAWWNLRDPVAATKPVPTPEKPAKAKREKSQKFVRKDWPVKGVDESITVHRVDGFMVADTGGTTFYALNNDGTPDYTFYADFEQVYEGYAKVNKWVVRGPDEKGEQWRSEGMGRSEALQLLVKEKEQQGGYRASPVAPPTLAAEPEQATEVVAAPPENPFATLSLKDLLQKIVNMGRYIEGYVKGRDDVFWPTHGTLGTLVTMAEARIKPEDRSDDFQAAIDELKQRFAEAPALENIDQRLAMRLPMRVPIFDANKRLSNPASAFPALLVGAAFGAGAYALTRHLRQS